MAVATGDPVILARAPGYRVETTTTTSDSSTFTTTETVVQSVTGSLIDGVKYQIVSSAAFEIGTDGVLRHAIREDSVSGTVRAVEDVNIVATGNDVHRSHLVAEYTATATGSKTFVATGDVTSGGGTANLNASSTNPSFLYIVVVE